jgi:beta-lactam-binding protein with PASTA domain
VIRGKRRKGRRGFDAEVEAPREGVESPTPPMVPADAAPGADPDAAPAGDAEGAGTAAASAAPGKHRVRMPKLKPIEMPKLKPIELIDSSEAEVIEHLETPADLGREMVESARGGRFRLLLWLFALGTLAFVTGLVVFNSVLMPRIIHGVGAEVRVPDLSQRPLEEAEAMLGRLRLQLSPTGERFDPGTPRGAIVWQDPPPGTPVRVGRRVQVMVSLGEEFSSVPELFGQSLRAAVMLIERAGLSVGDTVAAPGEVGAGLVAGTDPPADAVLPRDTPVHLLVSTGSGDDGYVMPELLGRDVPTVRRQLEALGFRVLTPEGAGSRGMVLMQNPPVGSRLERTTPIVVQGSGGRP